MHAEDRGMEASSAQEKTPRSFRLPADRLLKKPGQFQRVYSSGFRISGQDFSIIILGNDLESSRLGVSIHRKLRGSVRRNRIRRLAREYFRLHPQFADRLRAAKERIRSGRMDAEQTAYDIVITVRPAFSSTNYATFDAAIDAALTGRRQPAAPGDGGSRPCRPGGLQC